MIIRAKDTEDAVRIANDNEAGLSASVWTRDYKEALDVARSIESGAVRVFGCIVRRISCVTLSIGPHQWLVRARRTQPASRRHEGRSSGYKYPSARLTSYSTRHLDSDDSTEWPLFRPLLRPRRSPCTNLTPCRLLISNRSARRSA